MFGVDCNHCYDEFEEGIAPIDIEGLARMTSEDLPEDLDDLLALRTPMDKFIGCVGRWRLWILMENCD